MTRKTESQTFVGGKIEFRADGDQYRALMWAPDGSEAFDVASIHMAMVATNEYARALYVEAVTAAVSGILEEIVGERPEVAFQPAFKSRRNGGGAAMSWTLILLLEACDPPGCQTAELEARGYPTEEICEEAREGVETAMKHTYGVFRAQGCCTDIRETQR